MRFIDAIRKKIAGFNKRQAQPTDIHPQRIREELFKYPGSTPRRKAMATFLAHFLHNAQTEQDIQNSVSAAVSVFSTHTPSDAVQEVRRKAKPGYEPVLEKATREAHEYWSSPQQLPHIRSGAEKVIELARQEARAQDAAKKTRI